MNEIADFILRYPLIYRKRDRAKFIDWLQWHADHRMLLRCIDFDGDVAGVLIIRTIAKPQDVDREYVHDPEGEIAYIELAIADKPGVKNALILAALEQFGLREWIAWKRPPGFTTRFRETKRVLSKILGGQVHV